MDGQVSKSKKTGAFRKGLGGITGRFGRFFKLLGGKFGLVSLMAAAGVGMASLLDFEKTKGFFSDGAKGIGNAFKSLFGVLTDFTKSIANVASKAAASVATVVDNALKAVLPKSITGGAPEVFDKSQVLDKSGGAPDKSPNYTSASDDAVKTKTPTKLSTLDLADARFKPPTGDAPISKISKEVSEEVLKKSIAKNAFKLGAKAIIGVGAVVSGYFALSKLLKGDYVGAAMEGGDIFAPSLVGLPISTATAIRDTYNQAYGTDENPFPFDKDLATNPKETNKRLAKIKNSLMKQVGMAKKNNAIQPQETSSNPIDFSKIRNFKDYQKVQGQLRINPAYDADGSGAYSKLEFRRAQDAIIGRLGPQKMNQGPMFLQPTNIVTNNNSTVVNSRPVVDGSFAGSLSAR